MPDLDTGVSVVYSSDAERLVVESRDAAYEREADAVLRAERAEAALENVRNALIVEIDRAVALRRRIWEAVNRHPEPCTDTPFTCGWKGAVVDIRASLSGESDDA